MVAAAVLLAAVACGDGGKTDSSGATGGAPSGGSGTGGGPATGGGTAPTGGGGGTPGVGGSAAAGTAGSGTPTLPPTQPPAADCVVPEPPSARGSEVVVGDGTAASCTRDALAGALAAGGDVRFECGTEPVVIPITGELVVEADTVLDGGGLVTLDGQGTSRILRVAPAVHFAVRSVTFTRGAVTDAETPANGGAILGPREGSLDIRDCTFEGNSAGVEGDNGGGAVYMPDLSRMIIVRSRFVGNRGGHGGAVFNLQSGLTIVGSVFADNESVTDGGGGLYTDGGSHYNDDDIAGIIELCGCTFEGNIGRSQGGGAFLWAYPPDELRVNRCVFRDNQVLVIRDTGALGGGLRAGNASLDLSHSLFVGNHADRQGGGLWVDGLHPSRVSNCTFTENHAGDPAAAEDGLGGALAGSNLELAHLTLVGNGSKNFAGAIFNSDLTSTLRNSIIASNTAGNEWGITQGCMDPMAGGNNLQWPDPGDDVRCTGDLIIEEPGLGSLADNGGPSHTMLPGTGSPVLDRGSDCAADDQRGTQRGEPCDLGAVELPP